MRDVVDSKLEIAVEKLLGMKEMKSYIMCIRRYEMEERLMKVLRGVVYRLKRIRPRTDFVAIRK